MNTTVHISHLSAALLQKVKAVTIVGKDNKVIGHVTRAYDWQSYRYTANRDGDSHIEPCQSLQEAKMWIK